MTDEGIRIEYEADLAWRGETLKTCPQCGVETHRTQCPHCIVDGEALVISGDPVLDKAMAAVQAGEKIDMKALEEALRGGFEKVIPGEP
jgi:hypothetical protein